MEDTNTVLLEKTEDSDELTAYKCATLFEKLLYECYEDDLDDDDIIQLIEKRVKQYEKALADAEKCPAENINCAHCHNSIKCFIRTTSEYKEQLVRLANGIEDMDERHCIFYAAIAAIEVIYKIRRE